jgi:hypothetical protein
MLGAISLFAIAAALAPLVSAQTIAGSKQADVGKATVLHVDNYKAPLTPWGAPDVQGLWTNATITTLARPKEFGDRLVLTPEEIRKSEGEEAKQVADGQKPSDPNLKTEDLPASCGRGFTGANCGYNSFWIDPGSHAMNINGEYRTSFLVEPKNGQLPALTPEAQAAARGGAPRGGGPGMARGDNPESMTLAERCLKDFGSSSGPPMMPLLYNNTYQIVQTPTDVMILTEMVHDARIVHLVSGPAKDTHARPTDIKQWMGDAVGWYEGDTLVVETTNFRPGQGFRGMPSSGKLIERFRRVNDKQVEYTFEINEPKVFTAPIKAQIAMNATPGPLYEYACHEGNYALPHILAGNRKGDRDAAAAAAEAAAKATPAVAPKSAKPAAKPTSAPAAAPKTQPAVVKN